MRKKIVAALLFALMLTSTLSSCGNSTGKKDDVTVNLEDYNLDGTLPIAKDSTKAPTLQFAIVVPTQRIHPTGEVEVAKKLAKDTGMNIEWIEIPTNGAEEKINLMLSAGTKLPDAFWNGISNNMISQYADKGIFIPTEELVEQYMPRLSKVYTERPQYRAGATAPNGHMYGFPYIEEMEGLVLTPGPFIINKDWLDKVGKDIPTTVDEFTEVLKAFRDADDLNGNGVKDEIPYALDFTSKDAFGSYNTFHQFTAAFGQADSYCGLNKSMDHLALVDGKVVFTAIDPAYKATAEYFNMLNQEKLIDIDSFSPGPSEGQPLFLNKIKGDVATVGVMGLWAPVNEIPDKDVYKQYAPIPRLTGEKGETGFALNASEMQGTSRVVITVDSKYPELIAAFVDYCYDPEISITLNWGAEGFIYEKGDDGMLHFRLDDENNILLQEPYKTFGEMRENTTPLGGGLAVLNDYYGTVADYTWDALDLLDWQKQSGKVEILKESSTIPTMLLSSEEQTKISQVQPQLSDIVGRYTIQWILDGNIDATWDQYKSELDQAGLSDYLATVQKAYDRYTSVMNAK